jgi:hypothetical protein
VPVSHPWSTVAVSMLVLSLGQTLRIAGLATDLPLPWLPLSQRPLLELTVPAG